MAPFTQCLQKTDMFNRGVYGRKRGSFVNATIEEKEKKEKRWLLQDSFSHKISFIFPPWRKMHNSVSLQLLDTGEEKQLEKQSPSSWRHISQTSCSRQTCSGFYSHHESGLKPMGEHFGLLYTRVTLSKKKKKVSLQLQDLDRHSEKLITQIVKEMIATWVKTHVN